MCPWGSSFEILVEWLISWFVFRLEVQADVNTGHTNKRASLSSESANFSLDAKSAYSLDAKSATVSFSDDASTKALAGSICNRFVTESN